MTSTGSVPLSSDSPASAPPERWLGGRRPLWLDILHVSVLAAFALLQPLYDRLGARAGFLLDVGVVRGWLYVFVLALSCGIPALLALVELIAARLGRRIHEAVHGVLVFVMFFLVALPIVKLASWWIGEVIVALALIGGTIATWGYFTLPRWRSVITLATPGIVVFPTMFLLNSSVTGTLLARPELRPEELRPTPVVLLVLDELCGLTLQDDQGEIDAQCFPHIAELARHCSRFRNATTVHSETGFAVPAILSGRYPHTAWLPTPADLPQNLFSVLDSTDQFEMAIFEPVSNMAIDRHTGSELLASGSHFKPYLLADALWRVYLFHVMPADLQKDLPEVPRLWFGLRDSNGVDPDSRRGIFRYGWGERRDEQFAHFLRCLEPSDRPTLHFMHLLMPHVPWCYLPSTHRYSEDGDRWDLLNFNTHSDLMDYWGHDELLITHYQQRYLLQLMYLDRLIGDLVAKLKDSDLYDRCLLIVTADHGISFRAGGPRRSIEPGNLADILSVPLFVKRPYQTTGEISDRPVETIDILPTIAAELGMQLKLELDGTSLFDETAPPREVKAYCQGEEKFTVDIGITARSDLADTLRERFGSPRNLETIYRMGPAPELLGRAINELTISAEPSIKLELIRYGDSVGESTDLYPCYFEGRVRGENIPSAGMALAVAINGTIRATTRTFQIDGFRDRWAMLAPESAFHAGKNDVRFYALEKSGSEWRIAPCPWQLAPQPAPVAD